MKILFVCTGNTCRSPMAAGIFNMLIKQNNIDNITADSAGIYTQDGAAASQNAISAAQEIGADIHNHSTKKLTEQLINQSYEIYAMTENHKDSIEKNHPQSRGKVYVLGSGIDDPFGGSLEEYKKCRGQIKDAIEQIIIRIKQNG